MNINIKPDTSLYSDVEDKLRALAAALEATKGDALLEEQDPIDEHWEPANGSASEFLIGMSNGVEYRSRQKPRELWVIETPTGDFYREDDRPKVYSAEPTCTAGNRAVRFVEAL